MAVLGYARRAYTLRDLNYRAHVMGQDGCDAAAHSENRRRIFPPGTRDNRNIVESWESYTSAEKRKEPIVPNFDFNENGSTD